MVTGKSFPANRLFWAIHPTDSFDFIIRINKEPKKNRQVLKEPAG
jgi:hypothetical protein